MEFALLIKMGRLFQSLGAAEAKARSPLLLSPLGLFGTSKSNWLADLSALFGTYRSTSSDRYRGARPFRDL